MQSPGIDKKSPGIEEAFRSIGRIFRKHLKRFPELEYTKGKY